uniref:sn-1-specific diacylglycerol lipase ABHD11 n=1 Tax=Liphistius sp. SGP-2016 TaxID=1905180 RepID=A0A4Q8K4Y2_9ARAC
MLKKINFDARLALIVLLVFISSVISAALQHSLPDVKPVDLSCTCIHFSFDDSDEDLPPVILLHGLLGSRSSWQRINADIAIQTGREVYSCDARNHGTSPWTDEFDFEILAVDLNRMMENHHISKAILIGHSMGGATAMKLALAKPEKVEKLIVEDFAPHPITPEVAQSVLLFVKTMKESLRAIPEGSDLKSAKLAVRDYLISKLPPEFAADISAIKDPSSIPLVSKNGVYSWQMNLDSFIKWLESPESLQTSFSGEYNGDSLFIYGTKSPFKVYEAKDTIEKLFPKAQFRAIEGAGHDIHPNYPEFLTAVLEFIESE